MLLLSESHAIGSSNPAVRDLTLGALLADAAAPNRAAVASLQALPTSRRGDRGRTPSCSRRRRLRPAHCAPSSSRASGSPVLGRRTIPEWIIVQLASALAGTILVTVNPAFRAAEVTYVLKQSARSASSPRWSSAAPTCWRRSRQIQPDCPELREIIRFDQWPELLAAPTTSTGDLPDPTPTTR